MDPADAGPLGGAVALTFDDGPDPYQTPKILEVLRAYDIPATFFIVGEQLERVDNWDVMEEIVDDPLFLAANHSYDHADLSGLSSWAVEEEIDDATALIESFGVSPPFFRFPYGASTCETHDMVTDRGMRVAGWHIDTADWCYAAMGPVGSCDPDDYWRVPSEYEHDMRGLILEQVNRFDGGVVLFHDIHAYVADTLEDVIIDLLSEGYHFVALDDSSALPRLNSGTPVDLPYLGERCNVLHDRCWQVEYTAWCEPVDPEDPLNETGICTMPCEGLCLDRDGSATTFCATVVPGAGQCTSYAASQNVWCEDIEGADPTWIDRFVGSSGASPGTSEVCAPPHWVE
jgi:peptidoglycan-N-acetylglucosamine deacetylase